MQQSDSRLRKTVITHSFDQKIRLVYQALNSGNHNGFTLADLDKGRRILRYVGIQLAAEAVEHFFKGTLRPIKDRVTQQQFMQGIAEKADQIWHADETRNFLLRLFRQSLEGGFEGGDAPPPGIASIITKTVTDESDQSEAVSILPLMMHLVKEIGKHSVGGGFLLDFTQFRDKQIQFNEEQFMKIFKGACADAVQGLVGANTESAMQNTSFSSKAKTKTRRGSLCDLTGAGTNEWRVPKKKRGSLHFRTAAVNARKSGAATDAEASTSDNAKEPVTRKRGNSLSRLFGSSGELPSSNPSSPVDKPQTSATDSSSTFNETKQLLRDLRMHLDQEIGRSPSRVVGEEPQAVSAAQRGPQPDAPIESPGRHRSPKAVPSTGPSTGSMLENELMQQLLQAQQQNSQLQQHISRLESELEGSYTNIADRFRGSAGSILTSPLHRSSPLRQSALSTASKNNIDSGGTRTKDRHRAPPTGRVGGGSSTLPKRPAWGSPLGARNGSSTTTTSSSSVTPKGRLEKLREFAIKTEAGPSSSSHAHASQPTHQVPGMAAHQQGELQEQQAELIDRLSALNTVAAQSWCPGGNSTQLSTDENSAQDTTVDMSTCVLLSGDDHKRLQESIRKLIDERDELLERQASQIDAEERCAELEKEVKRVQQERDEVKTALDRKNAVHTQQAVDALLLELQEAKEEHRSEVKQLRSELERTQQERDKWMLQAAEAKLTQSSMMEVGASGLGFGA